MKRGADSRPSIFRTFRFSRFEEAAVFVAQLSRLGPEESELVQARVAKREVRVRIDPHPERGRAAAKEVLEELETLYRDGA